ncbi:hypothetical protein PRIPAC_97732, partial [Pristionchus pacificus]
FSVLSHLMNASEEGGEKGIVESTMRPAALDSDVPFTESSDFFFMVGVVTPLVVCCFAIFFCAVNSLWKTRKNLERLSQMEARPLPDYMEFTIDITTKLDSCLEMSSAQCNEEESVLL